MKKREPEEPYLDYSKFRLPKNFKKLVEEHRDITDQEKALKARKDEIKEALLPAMIAAKQRRLLVGKLRVLQYTGSSSQISGRKLLENGVASDIIVKSTVTTQYDAVRVEAVPDEGVLIG